MVDKSHWLITGAGGLLGSNAALELVGSGIGVTAYARQARPLAPISVLPINLGSPAERSGLIERHRPAVVLHSAAVSTIEGCEKDPELARRVNVDSSADLAEQTLQLGGKFVFISTDAVFDGRRGGYTEDESVSPTTEYGRSKADAEQAVLAIDPTALVLRVNFYGWSPSGSRSLAEFFHNRLENREPTRGFTDVTVSTLYVRDLVQAIRRLVEVEAAGLVHLASREATTKYKFGRRVAEAFGWDPSLVIAGRSAETLTVTRGSRLDLDVSLAERIIGARMPDQATSMRGFVRDANSNWRRQIRDFDRRT